MRTDTDGAACAQASPPARPTNIISHPPCMVVSYLPIRALHYKTREPPKSAPRRKSIFLRASSAGAAGAQDRLLYKPTIPALRRASPRLRLISAPLAFARRSRSKTGMAPIWEESLRPDELVELCSGEGAGRHDLERDVWGSGIEQRAGE